MTEYALGLIADFGLYFVAACVFFASLALPLPASVLVLAAGAFAATGDLSIEQVLLVTFSSFVLGDQAAFRLARRAGKPLLGRLRENPRSAALVERSDTLVADYGLAAVLISHTLLSPTAAYVAYICGASSMRWQSFSLVAAGGAAIWTLSLVYVGYAFSPRLGQMADLTTDIVIASAALVTVIALGKWLHGRWLAP